MRDSSFRSFNLIRHTRNYEAMLAFYRDHLALEPVESWDEPNNRGIILALPGLADSVSVEVLDLANLAQPGVAPANLAISLYVDSVQVWHDRLLAARVPIARGIEEVPWGLRSFGVDDPDGLRIWFQERLR